MSSVLTTDKERCIGRVAHCRCNAVTFNTASHFCWVKNIPDDHALNEDPDGQAYRLCPDEVLPVDPGVDEDPGDGVKCGRWFEERDLNQFDLREESKEVENRHVLAWGLPSQLVLNIFRYVFAIRASL